MSRQPAHIPVESEESHRFPSDEEAPATVAKAESRRFGEAGGAMPRACSGCGALSPLEAQFCTSCGRQIRVAPKVSIRERIFGRRLPPAPPPPPSAPPPLHRPVAPSFSGLSHLISGADRIAIIDVETTGLYQTDRVVEIAVVTLDANGTVVDVFETLINPGRDVGPTWVHQITASMVADAPAFDDVAHHVASRLDGAVIAAHNLPFDQRMLTKELGWAGIDVHWGTGLDTLWATGCKLGVACAEHGVAFEGLAHTALADAQATAHLLQAVAGAFPHPGAPAMARPLEVRPMRIRTRVGANHAEVPAPYLAALAQGLHSAPDVAPYAALLDQAIADLKLTDEERSELVALAEEHGLDAVRVARAHRDFITGLIEAAINDHEVTDDEYDQLCRAAALLDVDVKLVAQHTDSYRSTRGEVTFMPGMQVCFTGTAMDAFGREMDRSELEAMARERGLIPTDGVTKKGCDLLVASDPASRSGKAGKARRYGVPIASVVDFLTSSRTGSPLPVTRLSSAGTALVCVECGSSWLANRSSGRPVCVDCR